MCEVYRLQRDSFCLAVDFVDRYLAKEQNIKKNQLQLLGITALFIAAKLEEIYPPKLSEFAYVTDGACTESEILDKELVMLKVSSMCKLHISLLKKGTWIHIHLGDFMQQSEHFSHVISHNAENCNNTSDDDNKM